MGRVWGWQWRLLLNQEEQGLQSWLGKLGELGREEYQFERLVGEALVFQRAFITLHLTRRAHVANHYIDPRVVKVKAFEAGIPERTWWHRLHVAHQALRDVMGHQVTQRDDLAQGAIARMSRF